MRRCSSMCSSLTLPCVPTMCPLQRPRPSPPGRCRHPASVSCPCDVGTYGRRRRRRREI
ncbi:unnamed protein product [Staurois parvus]|uniref:Uncharacterized protein n=1 Tax=Staurois parvus TaxID=386267 RepID=A0ABN9FSQ2_9NEOB|nr:unnamed protein product [Staurois parvus]